MLWLEQSTSGTLKIGPFVDEDDGKTAETGLTISQADVRLSKNGGNMAQKNEATSCTHDELGIYGCPYDATDTGTLGTLQLFVHESGALPVWHEYMVVPANVWDSMFGTDLLKVDVHAIDDDETAANNLEAYCDGTTPIPANATQVSGDATAANNLEADYDGTGYNKSASEIATVATLTGHTAQGGDNYARLGAPAGASVSADIAAIKADSGNILTDTNELQGDLTDGGRLDLLIDAIKAVTDALPDAGALSDLATILVDTNELQADWTNGGRLDLLIDTIKVVTDSLTDLATVADQVWDEAIAGHLGAGSTGAALNGASAPTAAQVADQVWDEAAAEHVAAGSMGAQLGTDVNAILGGVATILADTAELQTDWTNGGRLDLLIDAIKVVTDSLTD